MVAGDVNGCLTPLNHCQGPAQLAGGSQQFKPPVSQAVANLFGWCAAFVSYGSNNFIATMSGSSRCRRDGSGV
jgi:hypothetical protein